MARKGKDTHTTRLLIDPSGQRKLFEKSYEQELQEERAREVECLGMKFPNDAARRAYFLDRLREHLQDPEFRRIEGFPIGEDEDILALSDPPYYTACPNPFIEEFIRCHGTPYDPNSPYSRKPFAVDVSEGKTDPIYKAHSYHTKVPHLAIVPSILHYTDPGDVILDGFCGSGMTGVAAQWCGTAPNTYRQELESKWEREGLGRPVWGHRHVVLNDLSPAASFISANYNLPFDAAVFAEAGERLLSEVEQELGWMYETRHAKGQSKGRIDYTVWSEVFSCPECAGEVVFVEEALDEETQRVRDSFPCPGCGAHLTKDKLERVFESQYDPGLRGPWRHIKLRPSLISYTFNGQHHEKSPDEDDLALLRRIEELPFPAGVPTVRFPIEQMGHGSRLEPKGFTHIHHLFLRRAIHALAALWRSANSQPDPRTRAMLLFFLDQSIIGMSVLNRYLPTAFSQVNRQLTGVYYVASQISEVSPRYNLNGKLKRLAKTFHAVTSPGGYAAIGTGSTTSLGIPSRIIDHVFTDPPFGENIPYADLNFLVESWYRVVTNVTPEAVIDKLRTKGLPQYQHLMQRCFEEYYRVLKPGRWMTMVFHNSRNAVWNAIQEALLAAGFVVADVRTMDKQQGSYRQVTSSAVKQDLVISAYKPNDGLEERFKIEAGTEEGVWDFVRTHLKQLPVFVARSGRAEVIAERQNYLLFDRMVAFHVQRGVTVPLSAGDFYAGLPQRFAERDGMHFMPDQVAEYDKKRMAVTEVLQLELFVTDEASAIQWLKQQLVRKPQTFQELHPQFLREISGWQKHEKPLELSAILDQNFLRYDGKEEVPSQIHSYLSSNFKELRGKQKDDAALKAKAKDRWYVPDPKKGGDLEKLREKSLLKEFEEYKGAKATRFKVFRVEAMRAGFKRAYDQRDYQAIVDVAERIPESVLQEDEKLLMYYDVASTRLGAHEDGKLF